MPKEQPAVTAGAAIKAYIQEHGITEAAAAKVGGLSQPTFHRLINDQTDPPFSTLLRVIGGLGLSLRWLHDRGVRPPEAS